MGNRLVAQIGWSGERWGGVQVLKNGQWKLDLSVTDKYCSCLSVCAVSDVHCEHVRILKDLVVE